MSFIQAEYAVNLTYRILLSSLSHLLDLNLASFRQICLASPSVFLLFCTNITGSDDILAQATLSLQRLVAFPFVCLFSACVLR